MLRNDAVLEYQTSRLLKIGEQRIIIEFVVLINVDFPLEYFHNQDANQTHRFPIGAITSHSVG